MDELIKQITDRTGLAPDKARTAVDTVVGFLKDRLPGPVASQLDGVLSGSGGGLADAAKGLGGMFGGK
ncbi:MAG TPA: hypothetical protein VFL95_06770 [Gemmatimonadales bacterium]|nr:hypothetical protein [Gemmatimonadales bacterium]